MKKFAWVMGTILLVLTVLFVSCTKVAPATAPTAEQPKVSATEGTLGEVNVPKSTVTVETPEGPKSFAITPKTALTFEGEACTLEQLADLTAARGEGFECTVTYDDEGNVLSLNVFRIPEPASVRGTISDVNIKESTITVKTAEGDKVFEVDPSTGLMIGGVACSLELVNALLEAEASIGLPCTVIYSTDDKGTALYIDIANPPNLIQGSGTVEKVDVAKSTVTIMTDKGERTFKVNAKTGQFLNGEVCSLDDLAEAVSHGDPAFLSPSCQVMYYTDKDGNLIYLDATHITKP